MLFQLEYRCLNPTYISHLKTMRLHQFIGFAFCLVCFPLAAAEYAVEPDVVELRGKYAQTQLVITQLIEGQIDPASDDVTATAVYKSSDPVVASVDSTGLDKLLSTPRAKSSRIALLSLQTIFCR